jgi:C-terminal processing protease CtpA/Prc
VGHPNWGIQQPAAAHFGGRVVVLMNGGSFSTTCEFLATLHNHGGAVFVGEETAGGYYGDTSGAEASLALPHSKLILPVHLVGYYLAIGGATQAAHGIRPDYPVEYSIEDILAGRDRAMEVALRLEPMGAAFPLFGPAEQAHCVLFQDQGAHFIADGDLFEVRHPAVRREQRVIRTEQHLPLQ